MAAARTPKKHADALARHTEELTREVDALEDAPARERKRAAADAPVVRKLSEEIGQQADRLREQAEESERVVDELDDRAGELADVADALEGMGEGEEDDAQAEDHA
ncbi:MAG TPA: hypothetical protein VE987_12995 [Polyangiaceae bacterium]|nr:hypothetical protein [Polyangiaceae bacterium]